MALKVRFGYRPWTEWPEPFRDGNGEAVRAWAAENGEELHFWQFTQYLFLKQWRALRDYARERGVADHGGYAHLRGGRQRGDVEASQGAVFARRGGESRRGGRGAADAFSETGQLWAIPSTIGRR